MANNYINVDIEKFNNAAKVFKDSGDKCDDIKRKISNSTNDLISSWEGKSESTFSTEFQKFENKMNNYKDMLTYMSNELSQIALTYSQREEANEKSFKNMQK